MPNNLNDYHNHLQRAADMETTSGEIRQGFVRWALEKATRMSPYVEEARALQAAASQARSPADLLNLPQLRQALVTAAGLSNKADDEMKDEDRNQAIQNLIQTYLEPAGSAFVEELVFRFLLVRGGTLAGELNNLVGRYAQQVLTRAVMANLSLLGCEFQVQYDGTKQWAAVQPGTAEVERFIKGLAWSYRSEWRVLLFNVKVPIVGNNVDIVLLRCAPDAALVSSTLRNVGLYIALGELKGGIDPAGADEHWKTARTALQRIVTRFSTVELRPKAFFVGGAISTRMSQEIWSFLESHVLDNAANLNQSGQLNSICGWLCSM